MKKEDRFFQLIADKLAGEAGPEELRELDALLQEDRNSAATLALLEVIWGTWEAVDEEKSKQDFERHMRRMQERGE